MEAVDSEPATLTLCVISRSPGHRVPWWVLIWIKRSPLVFLVMSVACFSIGLCLFTYASGQVGFLPPNVHVSILTASLRAITVPSHIDINHRVHRIHFIRPRSRFGMVRIRTLDLPPSPWPEMAQRCAHGVRGHAHEFARRRAHAPRFPCRRPTPQANSQILVPHILQSPQAPHQELHRWPRPRSQHPTCHTRPERAPVRCTPHIRRGEVDHVVRFPQGPFYSCTQLAERQTLRYTANTSHLRLSGQAVMAPRHPKRQDAFSRLGGAFWRCGEPPRVVPSAHDVVELDSG